MICGFSMLVFQHFKKTPHFLPLGGLFWAFIVRFILDFASEGGSGRELRSEQPVFQTPVGSVELASAGSGRFGDLLLDFFGGGFLFESGEDPEVVAEDGPANHHFTVLESFGARGLTHEVADDDLCAEASAKEYADPRFGPGAAFQAFAHAGFVLKALAEFGDVARAEAAADAIIFYQFVVGELAFSNDAFVGLCDGGGELVEDVLNPVRDLS